MKKKVLIYMESSELAPVGGPRGYIYNLKKELDKRVDTNIFFINEGRKNINACKKIINKMKKGRIKNILITIKSIIKHYRLVYGKNHIAMLDLNDYDIVHFHSTLDMYGVRDSLKKYSGKVILSSHSPTLLSKEIYESRSKFEKKFMKFIYNRLIEMDIYSFTNADYLIFPCEESEEPYFGNWDGFSRIKEEKKENFRYILTGIEKCNKKLDKNFIREKYNIPKEAFLISYVGRHNEIKGYDILKKIGKELLEDENIYFLVAGNETPLTGLNHKRWIEVGWTNDPYSLIAASDIFILPNRETYFDLVMLEVLSLGKIILASRTGGNKYFDKINAKAVYLYNNEKEAIEKIKQIKSFDYSIVKELEKSNKDLFENKFTSEIFANNYLTIYKELLDNC